MSKFIKKYLQSIITIIIIIFIILGYKLTYIVTDILDLHLYFGWQEIKLNNSFSFKIPGNWVQGEKNGLIYFYDPDIKSDENSEYSQNDNIVLFQSKSDDMFAFGDAVEINKKTEKNILSDNFQSVVSLSGNVNSLGTVYGESIISVDNVTYKEDYIIFNDYSSDFLFYSWGEGIDDETLEKIADSVDFIN